MHTDTQKHLLPLYPDVLVGFTFRVKRFGERKVVRVTARPQANTLSVPIFGCLFYFMYIHELLTRHHPSYYLSVQPSNYQAVGLGEKSCHLEFKEVWQGERGT